MSSDPHKHHDHGHRDHTHDDDGQDIPSATALRVKALESLLVEKGLVDAAALDAIVDAYETKIGPRNGARVVARAWTDPAYNEVRFVGRRCWPSPTNVRISNDLRVKVSVSG